MAVVLISDLEHAGVGPNCLDSAIITKDRLSILGKIVDTHGIKEKEEELVVLNKGLSMPS